MRKLTMVAVVVAVTLAACGGGDAPSNGAGGDDESSAAARPESPAVLTIESPKNGDEVKTGEVPVELDLEGGEVVAATERELTPTTGHIHVELDGVVVSMNYGLKQPIEVAEPGTHTLRVEFVAADHLPFDPRVFQEIAFTAK
ncbi:MAG TPA: hypothetical protein VIG64_02985 [Actinomycetota bacterium]